MAKRRIIPQPPIDRHARPTEARLIWAGIALIILACVCIVAGAMATHTVKQAEGSFSEYELNRAAVVGGVDKLDQGDTYCPT